MCAQYQRKDHLYNRAKSEGLRSRATYKIEEINKKHQIINQKSKVLDLGAWPGGWLQYVRQVLGPSGKAVGIDLVKIEDLHDPKILCIEGDARDEAVLSQASSFVGGKFNVVVSDMSPKLTGIKEADQAASVALAELAIDITRKSLESGGNFVCKVFKGPDTDEFIKQTRPLFKKLIRSELDSSRNTSNEYYVIGLGLL
jgi:23S rRNA (uridine2552-2'-O)-methyltransferase